MPPNSPQAEVSGIFVDKISDQQTSAIRYANLHITITWPETLRPIAARPPTLTRAEYKGQSLLREPTRRRLTRPVRYGETEKRVFYRLKDGLPGNARAVTNIEGTVDLLLRGTTSSVVIQDLSSLVGATTTGIPELDNLGIRITRITDRSITIYNPGTHTIVLKPARADGSISQQKSADDDLHHFTFTFSEDLAQAANVTINLIAPQQTITLPFRCRKIAIP